MICLSNPLTALHRCKNKIALLATAIINCEFFITDLRKYRLSKTGYFTAYTYGDETSLKFLQLLIAKKMFSHDDSAHARPSQWEGGQPKSPLPPSAKLGRGSARHHYPCPIYDGIIYFEILI
jgi:hypothetical protein